MQRNSIHTYKKPQRWPGATYWMILFITIVLLISLTVGFFTSLALTGGVADTNDPNGSGNNGSIVNNDAKRGNKTGIVLPSATPSGKYLSTTSENFQTVSGITSEAAILVDADSMAAVAGKNQDVVIHPASMTKVMTLLVACERLDVCETA